MEFRLKHYNREDLVDKELVMIRVNYLGRGTFSVNPAEIKKFTAKQIVVVANNTSHHMSLTKVGLYDWYGVLCPREDTDEIIKTYIDLKVEDLNSKISLEQKEIKSLLKIKEDFENGY